MSDNSLNAKEEILKLRERILSADRAYYVDSMPVITDAEYDLLFNRLLELESLYPEYDDESSPTKRVGSDIDISLPEFSHKIPVLSLEKCYNIPELLSWISKNSEKLNNEIEILVEPKIDGAGVVLYYENGKFVRALTRGNGYFGNDITSNMKTIGSVPLTVPEKTNFAVRGEVFITKEDFSIFNEKYAEGKYSNPRNLASGAVRRLKSKEVKLFPLKLICYESFYENEKHKKHIDSLIELKNQGFPVNEYLGFFSNSAVFDKLPFKKIFTKKVSDISSYIESFKSERKNISYEIDGLVLKINDLIQREALGFTQHHPRWAIAFKFDAPVAESKVLSIDIQIGRGGRATPVANLSPVELAGSVISRATLHNQDYIDALGVSEGDRVTISKRGDVIPAVEEVLEKGENASTYKITERCPSCSEKLIKDGAHLFCMNEKCPARVLESLKYFVSRDQMDIETLGGKTIEFLFEKGFIKNIIDIYTFDYQKLLNFEGFKDKKVNNIISALEKSKGKDFNIVLSSLGLKDIGAKVSELLSKKFNNIDQIIMIAEENKKEELLSIEGIGESIALSIIEHFKNKKILFLIDGLKKVGLHFENLKKNYMPEADKFLSGTKWVITGSFKNYQPREKASELIKKYGGEVLSSVTSKTSYLLAGAEAGSKLEKAKTLDIKIINEDDFNKIINEKSIL